MTTPPPPATCPKCHTVLPPEAPHGLCPACLMDAAGTESEPGIPADPFAAPLDLETLRRAFPQLEILAPLGAGGMGPVYKARQPNLDRIVALKVLPPEFARDPAWVERFTREARALARLNHPHIVQVYDVGQTAAAPGVPALCWLVMEYVDGVTLRQVQRTGGLSAREALAIIPKLCDALEYAHEKGVLHRDIKPENILLALEDVAEPDNIEDGRVRVKPRRIPAREDIRTAPRELEAGSRSTTSLLLLMVVLLADLAVGLFAGRRAALVLLALTAACGLLLWMILAMNADHGRGFAALSGRTEVSRNAQPHGCIAMIAFSAALLLALAPPVAATCAVLTGMSQGWSIAFMAGCGVLSFVTLQPLLRITGMHHNPLVRQRRIFGLIGATLCAVAMMWSGFMSAMWQPRGHMWTLRWSVPEDSAARHLTEQEIRSTLEDVFGTSAKEFEVKPLERSSRTGRSGSGEWMLNASGPPRVGRGSPVAAFRGKAGDPRGIESRVAKSEGEFEIVASRDLARAERV